MSGGHDAWLDLCAVLALGALEPADRRALDEHLAAGCGACEALLADLAVPLEALAHSLPPARPSRGLKARVLVALAQAPPRGRPGSGRGAAAAPDAPTLLGVPRWMWLLCGACLLAAVLGWWRACALSERLDAVAAESRPVPR